jgi:two-component system response regulator PilR (NtrC family)
MAKELGRPALRFTPEAMAALQSYAFPGNVRQLQNMVERAATLSERDEIGLETLPPSVSGRTEPPSRSEVPLAPGFSLERHLDQAERAYLLEALKRAGGVKTRAAELLGLSFRSFRYRLARHGLSVADEDPGLPR